jgi:hypothetical protein
MGQTGRCRCSASQGVNDLLKTSGTHVLSATALRKRFGAKCVGRRQLVAQRRLVRILCEGKEVRLQTPTSNLF